MANNLVIRALKANSKSFNLSSKKMTEVPKSVARLTHILTLYLNNNSLTSLPVELQTLRNLTELNLGNNSLDEVPSVLRYLNTLKKLYLFGNHITRLPPEVLDGLDNLTLLNLNHNHITVLPPEIKSLSNLETLSLLDNQLEELPVEIGFLKKMVEMNLTNNKLSRLPKQIYSLSQLARLYLARNNLTELPEGVIGLMKLRVLDVAGNRLSMFPVDFQLLTLNELLCEGNTFVKNKLMESVQAVEVLSLKELSARQILVEDKSRLGVVHRALSYHPGLSLLLADWGRCSLCLQPFLTTWLECVRFINLRKDMKMSRPQTVPVRVLLCSYKCFNKSGHSYYGVASV
ncbi:leucine-rich repeat-containing protein 69 [Oncorhynchus clarkii lewisi]|uniref:leucine-rich repeat-containing protein 69 n=1 Tax=Oncorhynchus clarkii lewisi TaxID=490388 RepID=UPI0039B944B3